MQLAGATPAQPSNPQVNGQTPERRRTAVDTSLYTADTLLEACRQLPAPSSTISLAPAAVLSYMKRDCSFTRPQETQDGHACRRVSHGERPAASGWRDQQTVEGRRSFCKRHLPGVLTSYHLASPNARQWHFQEACSLCCSSAVLLSQVMHNPAADVNVVLCRDSCQRRM